MTLPLYVYWEGEPKPYYTACIRTILHHNPDAIVMDRAAATAIVGPLPPVVESAYVVHRVDWIRKRLVYETGGMYVDADFICLRPLDSIRQLAADFDYAGYREWDGSATWMDNFFAARKGSPVLTDAADHALAQMNELGQDVPWLCVPLFSRQGSDTSRHAELYRMALVHELLLSGAVGGAARGHSGWV